ncbi:hypothetical protein CRUP_027930, partial [Coryphaenoides rupestris]
TRLRPTVAAHSTTSTRSGAASTRCARRKRAHMAARVAWPEGKEYRSTEKVANMSMRLWAGRRRRTRALRPGPGAALGEQEHTSVSMASNTILNNTSVSMASNTILNNTSVSMASNTILNNTSVSMASNTTLNNTSVSMASRHATPGWEVSWFKPHRAQMLDQQQQPDQAVPASQGTPWPETSSSFIRGRMLPQDESSQAQTPRRLESHRSTASRELSAMPRTDGFSRMQSSSGSAEPPAEPLEEPEPRRRVGLSEARSRAAASEPWLRLRDMIPLGPGLPPGLRV